MPIRQLRGIDFMKDCLPSPDMGSQLIIGGTQKSEKELVKLVSEYFGKQVNLSLHQPEFSGDISVLYASSIMAIKRIQPKTLWLGIGTPKQDYLASRLRSEFDGDIFCVGAAIAFLVGDVLESPKWIQRAGLEWFYRLVREPGRLWRRYLFGNFQFLGMLIKDFAFRRVSK
jgi:N-acetylglucosaminyldiphosphoundecaprenol N-acetyl-beta-D-mannosaminyltransferase